MNKTGKNLTPPDLRAAERKPLNDLCHRYLCHVVRLLRVKVVVGIGKFAKERAKVALEDGGIEGVRVEAIMHPSPANPAANKGWEEVAKRQLEELGLMHFLLDDSPIVNWTLTQSHGWIKQVAKQHRHDRSSYQGGHQVAKQPL